MRTLQQRHAEALTRLEARWAERLEASTGAAAAQARASDEARAIRDAAAAERAELEARHARETAALERERDAARAEVAAGAERLSKEKAARAEERARAEAEAERARRDRAEREAWQREALERQERALETLQRAHSEEISRMQQRQRSGALEHSKCPRGIEDRPPPGPRPSTEHDGGSEAQREALERVARAVAALRADLHETNEERRRARRERHRRRWEECDDGPTLPDPSPRGGDEGRRAVLATARELATLPGANYRDIKNRLMLTYGTETVEAMKRDLVAALRASGIAVRVTKKPRRPPRTGADNGRPARARVPDVRRPGSVASTAVSSTASSASSSAASSTTARLLRRARRAVHEDENATYRSIKQTLIGAFGAGAVERAKRELVAALQEEGLTVRVGRKPRDRRGAFRSSSKDGRAEEDADTSLASCASRAVLVPRRSTPVKAAASAGGRAADDDAGSQGPATPGAVLAGLPMSPVPAAGVGPSPFREA
jgi:hypothetical protein